MLLIQCTKKLLNELKVDSSNEVTSDNPLFAWHANVITQRRRKTVVLMNDFSRYVIVLHGLKAKDFKNFDELFLQAIRETFHAENIREEVIDAYISRAQEVNYSSTKGRATVARLNKACEYTYFYENELRQGSMIQSDLSKKASRLTVGRGTKDYMRPNEEFYRGLAEWFGESIFIKEAIVLRVTMDLINHHVYRKIVVPKHITFPELHNVLQIAFGWQDYHLHEFSIYPSRPYVVESRHRREYGKPLVSLVCSEETLSYDYGVPQKMETGEKLNDYLPAEIIYTYDYGDDWRHHIRVEDVIDDYDRNYAMCLEGDGIAPPEDVGGEPGFDHFLSVIKDKNNPDYDWMNDWGRGQGYSNFDLELINRRFRFM
ncbi:plasmid pRiA4b ORF-3 family protein [Bacillaceae bacterium W0354]